MLLVGFAIERIFLSVCVGFYPRRVLLFRLAACAERIAACVTFKKLGPSTETRLQGYFSVFIRKRGRTVRAILILVQSSAVMAFLREVLMNLK